MKVMKNQGKTWNSQQSDIDHFAKLQNSFLQKFLKHLLIDNLQQYLQCFYQKFCKTKIHNRSAKSLSQDLFQISEILSIETLISTIRDYIKPKCPSFLGGQLQRVMELQYCNLSSQQRPDLGAGQLAVVQVKIRLDIQKIEELPWLIQQRILSVIQKAETGCPVTQLLKNYTKENMNFVIIYFGEYNFQLVNKHNYIKQECYFLGRRYKLRIFTIFISKIGLLETFRHLNKIEHPQSINDLTIQLYQMKRQKAKRKKQKKQAKAKKNEQDAKKLQNRNLLQKYAIKAIIGIAVLGLTAYVIKKIFK